MSSFNFARSGLWAVASADNRYPFEAYEFVARVLSSFGPGKAWLTGFDILSQAVRFAVDSYGFLAPYIMRRIGIEHGSNIGAIIYMLIGADILREGPEDSPEDFAYDRLLQDMEMLWEKEMKEMPL